MPAIKMLLQREGIIGLKKLMIGAGGARGEKIARRSEVCGRNWEGRTPANGAIGRPEMRKAEPKKHPAGACRLSSTVRNLHQTSDPGAATGRFVESCWRWPGRWCPPG